MNNKRDYYIYERGNCNKCNLHKPTNYLDICERCDKVSDTDNNVAIKPSTIEQDLEFDRQLYDVIISYSYNKVNWGDTKKSVVELIRTKLIDEIVGLIEPEWEDPDIIGTFIEDKGEHAVYNPVIRNQFRQELKTKLIELKEKV